MIRQWLTQLALWWLDERAATNPYELCMAYGGGEVYEGNVRVCKKRRYHVDSHAYDFWLRDD